VPERPAALVLEDGRSFVGESIGAHLPAAGEVVFNTAMTGYQEVLTDPSYAGQMVCMTYPLQGNYGLAQCNQESFGVWARAFIVRWHCSQPSHHAAVQSLDDYLRGHHVAGIQGLDTRALTRHLRSRGALRAVLSEEPEPPSLRRLSELADLARRVTPLSEQDLVAQVSSREVDQWLEPLPEELRPPSWSDGTGLTLAVVDYGVKLNILRSLRQRGCQVVVLPHTATWEDVRGTGADGLLLPNGPGDPGVLTGPVELCRQAIGRIPIFGICLGHQVLGRAIGGSTSRLPFGHHGVNHPVKDLARNRIVITSQNHEFQVDRASLTEGDFRVSHVSVHDGSVEGIAHRSLPVFSVQYHPEGCPGPQDSQHLFDQFVDMVRTHRAPLHVVPSLPEQRPPRKVLIIGSGPIVIGQAAEFDYAGTQACKALREEGVETVLVNSNPATIMTDEEIADRVYIEPLTREALEKVIERERPDGLLPTLGGQTGLNLAMGLQKSGVLQRFGVRFLGADAEVIRRAEDRQAFKELLAEIGEPVPPSRVCQSLVEAKEFAAELGLPLVVRPAYTLGGTGGGFVTTEAELERVVLGGISASPIGQVLVERSLWGWKEIEYEVMRDAADTCITVCNMENLDPMGVHTGDSIVVAPAQTLSDRDHQMLRSAALRIIRALGLEGGCNIQFALDPASSHYHVIEVNPRVSRSSALASKATGYPIARVAAKVAVGRRLDEIRNEVTGRTYAAFEPALDYVVVKIPRWPFDKFPGADRRLGTQMKSTGEVMAIERTFEGALAKALRSLEQPPPSASELEDPSLVEVPNDLRLFALINALQRGTSPDDLARRSGVDIWFVQRIQTMLVEPAPERPVTYKMVDTCAAEFEAVTPYYYSCREEESEATPRPGGSVLVVGSGPIRIGQGIEFDYCSVHAAWALREAGVRAIMVNSNPETVSTDFETSDRLYFEPLDLEAARAIARNEGVAGLVLQFGGQTAVNLAEPLANSRLTVLGSPVEAIDLAEDRRRFAGAMSSLEIPQPPGGAASTTLEAKAVADSIGYPVLVRPSYVLGGRAMQIVSDADQLGRLMDGALGPRQRGSLLIDRYLAGIEVEVDAISDGRTVLIPGLMEHVERAGIHSGDSMAVYPAPRLNPQSVSRIVDYTVRIARRLGLKGLFNAQFVLDYGQVYILEVNPRASRTVPFLSKVTGVPMVKLATLVMLGRSLRELGYETGLLPPRPLYAVKAPVFSANKLPGVDNALGPEMRSTGEVMGVDRCLSAALGKAFLAGGIRLSRGSLVLLAPCQEHRSEALGLAVRLKELGCRLLTLEPRLWARKEPDLMACGANLEQALRDMERGAIDLAVVTARDRQSVRDPTSAIRRAAAERGVPCLSSMDTARALANSAAFAAGALDVRCLDEWRAGQPVAGAALLEFPIQPEAERLSVEESI
jgi:carbamoyl-phosphate synthase large subunit